MTPIEFNRAMHRGLQANATGDLNQAEKIFRSLLAKQPNNAGVLQALGVIAAQMQHFDEAIPLLQRAVKLQPSGQLYYNLGNALRNSAKVDEAIAAFREAVRLQPEFPESHRNLGNLLRERGQPEEAVACQRQSVRLQPQNPDAHNSLGMALLVNEDPEHAAEAFRAALALDPNHADAFNNVGVAMVRSVITQMNNRALDEAETELNRAIDLRPDFAAAWSNLGHVRRTLGRVDEALAAYRKASQIEPNSPEIQGDVLFTLNYLSWDDPRALFEEHRAWAARHLLPTVEPPAFTNDRAPDRRLRIGYVSPDFRRHVVSFFTLPLLQNHNPQNVELFAYANVVKEDTVTEGMKPLFQHWREILGKSDADAATLIRSDQIDILVDLTGHTGGNRLGIFNQKPAPVQVTYLGYPNTTGIAAIDYRFTDALVDPPGLADELCVEKLWRLPDCAWCYQPPVESPEIQMRVEDRLTFACFNALAKVSPEVLDLWGDLLKAVPHAHILFKSSGTGPLSTQKRLIAEFAKRGVSEDRVDVRPYAPGAGDHLKVYFDADIALDTFPYHGTTTTCESLWMGLPVVTLAGKSHVSRVGVSLLTNVGLPQFVAQSPADYVRIAVDLAQNRKLRDELRPDCGRACWRRP